MTNPTNSNSHQYWSKTLQYQQRQGQQRQPGKQQTQPRQEKKAEDHGGFDSLLVDRKCKIKTGTGEVIEGLITATSKFWYLVNVDGQIVIVNKAYVVSIMPIQKPNENNQQNNPAGEVSGNGRGQPLGT
jgi:hypothetical protein